MPNSFGGEIYHEFPVIVNARACWISKVYTYSWDQLHPTVLWMTKTKTCQNSTRNLNQLFVTIENLGTFIVGRQYSYCFKWSSNMVSNKKYNCLPIHVIDKNFIVRVRIIIFYQLNYRVVYFEQLYTSVNLYSTTFLFLICFSFNMLPFSG